jgi:hypothetical protein
MFLEDIFEVNPQTFTLKMSLYLRFEWSDNRISANGTEGPVNMEHSFINLVWKPDIYIWNLHGQEIYSHQITMRSLTVTNNSGDVSLSYVLEIGVGVVCPMNYSRFPFDRNDCTFRMSAFTFTDDQMLFLTNSSLPPDHVLVKEKIRHYDLSLAYLAVSDSRVPSWESPGKFYSVPGIRILLANRPGKYVWVYYLPTSLFTLTSWFSFLLPPTSYPARTALLITIFLCQINLFNGVLRETPSANGGEESLPGK